VRGKRRGTLLHSWIETFTKMVGDLLQWPSGEMRQSPYQPAGHGFQGRDLRYQEILNPLSSDPASVGPRWDGVGRGNEERDTGSALKLISECVSFDRSRVCLRERSYSARMDNVAAQMSIFDIATASLEHRGGEESDAAIYK